ncbi:MAG: T9SS type A sorting domain-containing protein [Bacteroidia bacterium]|nr:T9SS type A sorting domain-containing protein [Bacteroidia bacterium]
MKNTGLLIRSVIVFALLLSPATSVLAQKFTYSVETTSEKYEHLESPTVVTNSPGGESYNAKIPFSFSVFGKEFDMSKGSGITIWRDAYLVDYNFHGLTLEAYYAALKPKGENSSINYQITGTSPNRILKFEWNNMGLVNHDTTDFINVQLWLHEKGNVVSVHIGPHQITGVAAFGGGNGPEIGLLRYDPFNGYFPEMQELIGDPQDPEVVFDVDQRLDGVPAENTVYTFNPEGVSSVDETANEIVAKVSPNPVTDQTSIYVGSGFNINTTRLEVFTATGKKVELNSPKTESGFVLNTSNTPAGLYFCRLTDGTKSTTIRFMKH